MRKKRTISVNECYEDRIEAGKLINPSNSFIFQKYVNEVDPYGIMDDTPPEFESINRATFVYSPDVGEVLIDHVPGKTLKKLGWRSQVDDEEFLL
ncbi:hypothetical protein N8I71_16785 [Roseibacterium sp. SDUM158016]|uniref:hypothetical protein n=1 Tax=Roseicyclus sediminis TaxID=2980997 RepID=UPI0021D2CF60|nr:hypothetical protein [Roseibacterium sp. SDUM158016]MCU4654498.1 hypothetical protein [Roseibacterium sp. SDUM158016]